MGIGPHAPVRALVAGGGTAGHVEPALAIADALMARRPGSTVVALGTPTGLETRLVPARGYRLATVPKVVMPRRMSADALSFPFRLRAAIKQAGTAIDELQADIVIGVGGYASAPAYLAARKRNLPIVIHEANATAGWANKLGARFTRYVATTHPATVLPHMRQTGLPLREAVRTVDRAAMRAQARRTYSLAPELPTLLVTGGSSGARRINEAMLGAAAALTEHSQVLHVTGLSAAQEITASIDAALHGTARERYVVLPYADRMELAYSAADFAVTRGGANTCAELAAVALPALVVPLPIGNGEQRINAEPLRAAGGALVVDDADLTAEVLIRDLLPLLQDSARLQQMSAALRSLPAGRATEAFMELVDEALSHGAARG